MTLLLFVSQYQKRCCTCGTFFFFFQQILLTLKLCLWMFCRFLFFFLGGHLANQQTCSCNPFSKTKNKQKKLCVETISFCCAVNEMLFPSINTCECINCVNNFCCRNDSQRIMLHSSALWRCDPFWGQFHAPNVLLYCVVYFSFSNQQC